MNTDIEILLVEDNQTDAEMTIHVLRKNNLANKLLHVKDGAEALDFIFSEGEYTNRQMEQRPKVVLMDLKMPKVNGIEVLERIRADKRTENIPVVILTSSKEDPDIKKCYELGVNAYVVKPVSFDEFQKAIAQLGLFWMVTNQSPV